MKFLFTCNKIIYNRVLNKLIIIILSFVFLPILLFSSQNCGDPLPSDIDSSLVTQLQNEYPAYYAPTTPPFNAFTNFENSVSYNFWDDGHLINYGWALNTSDPQYYGIAIINYYTVMDTKADEVIYYLEQIDSNFKITAISSAYRNPARNSIVGGSTNSFHIYGSAIDFDILYGLQEAQNVWDAILNTNSVELLNGAYGRQYYNTRPSESDDPPTGWIHVAW